MHWVRIMMFCGRYDAQHNDANNNDIQHSDTHHNNIQHATLRLSILAKHCYAECHLYWLSFMLNATYKPLMLSIVMLSIIAAFCGKFWLKRLLYNVIFCNQTFKNELKATQDTNTICPQTSACSDIHLKIVRTLPTEKIFNALYIFNLTNNVTNKIHHF